MNYHSLGAKIELNRPISIFTKINPYILNGKNFLLLLKDNYFDIRLIWRKMN